ncbi:ribosomal protein S18-alanine N-acetyltransferase [Chitinimonas sp. BJB300]|uniref:ribosomal protein S18-alanine N-acetyltransferase n=1 Tax=Chitinimonas sp. BJB300 TaxID=1559339 RepID=UPI000C0E2878|nr:ribosomal protein S18-alanine N-acetyltransferase [Chitinimonas sp. BJB300]PHV11533.1 ribosomal-protein-alanine N-acetyltransferase [Chitinimonas sp. BJB300]TSJ87241.1 ribosomal-protein-alanine N-acetyltransferase [Chitinimonas sp. BJB300]
MTDSLSITFRPFEETDLPAMADIEADLQAFPWTALQFIQSFSEGHRGLVAMAQGELIGFAVTQMVLDELSLLTLGVRRDWQRRGIARQLVQALTEQASEQGAAVLMLEVRKSNAPARSLYRRLGFVETGVRKGYYRAEEGREDAILMALTLDEGGR